MTAITETRRNHLIWIGLAVTVAGVLSYFMVFARYPVLRDFPWVNLPLVALGFGLSAAGARRAFGRSEVFRGKVLAPLGALLSLFLGSLFVYYIFGLSYVLPPPTEATLSLVRAPGFALASAAGEMVRLDDYRGRKVVLVFYRGFW